MKPVITLFLFLLFTLGGSFNYAHANEHESETACFLKTKIEKKLSSETVITHPECAGQAPAEKEELNCIICIEDGEDEDTGDKHVLQPRCFMAFYYAFIASDDCSIIAATFLFRKHLSYLGSCKYITQRVLKI